MNIIKQKILNFIISFIACVILSACQTTDSPKTPKSAETVEVAILMPMTGVNSTAGQQYNKLIKMGLADGLKIDIHVTSYDGGNEQQILAAMEKIVARRTKIILGPLYSPLVSLIADKAKRHGITIITLSNDPALADQQLFVFGHAPLKQLDRMINYLLDNNYNNFIALLPAGQHSQTVAKIIQNMVIEKNATLVRTEFYSEKPESISKAVEVVSDSVDNLNELDDILMKPIVYLIDDNTNLRLLFDSIHKYNLDKKAVIVGDNRLDIDYPQATEIMFTGSLNFLNSNISQKAKDLGINHLSFMHLMAYDLGRMTANYMGEEFSEQRFLARLNNPEPYIGVSGNIFFTDSIAQRQYDIIKQENGIYTTLGRD